MKWNGSTYIYAFGCTWTQFDGKHVIYVKFLLPTQLDCTLPAELWPLSIVLMTLLPIGTEKVVIDVLFTVLSYHLPICNQRDL